MDKNEKETAKKKMKATIDDLANNLEAAKNELNQVNDPLTGQRNDSNDTEIKKSELSLKACKPFWTKRQKKS